MHDGSWTLADCPPSTQAELARALGVSEVTAAVLARRSYLDPDDARRFLERIAHYLTSKDIVLEQSEGAPAA